MEQIALERSQTKLVEQERCQILLAKKELEHSYNELKSQNQTLT